MLESQQDEKVKHSLTIINKALWEYEKIAVACSGGKDSIVTLDLVRKIDSEIPVFFVATIFHPEETLAFMENLKHKWNLNLKIYKSNEQVSASLHKTNPDKCCYILKVKPTIEAVKDLDAWITGVRNTEGITRASFSEVEFRGLTKINPVVDWSEADIWRYTAVNQLPVHSFYALGYRSIGCQPCSQPNTENERGGRWAGTEKEGGECGIHTCKLKEA